MKIGLIVPGFSASESDWCIPALLDLVRELSRAHRVHVFALRYPHRRARYTVYSAQVHACGGALAAGLGRLPLLTRALTAVVAEARRGAFDVLHGVWADEPGFLAVSAGRLLDTPALVSVAGGELVAFPDIGYGGQLSLLNRWLTGRALRAARQVTVGSRLLLSLAKEHGAARPILAPLGVDTLRFFPSRRLQRTADESGPKRLLHVASLLPVKDQATLLRALAQVVATRPDVVLDIAGDGPLRQPLHRLAQTLGIAAHVRFLGALPHERLPELYRNSDLCLLSSRHESQNLAILEAAACGTPVVGTAVGVLPELAPPDCAVPVGDAGAMAAAILRLLGDDTRRQLLGEMQCEMVQQRFTLDRTIEKLTALYAE